MKVRLKEAITLRSEYLPAGAEINEDPVTAAQLINEGQADAVTVSAEKPAKSSVPQPENQE